MCFEQQLFTSASLYYSVFLNYEIICLNCLIIHNDPSLIKQDSTLPLGQRVETAQKFNKKEKILYNSCSNKTLGEFLLDC